MPVSKLILSAPLRPDNCRGKVLQKYRGLDPFKLHRTFLFETAKMMKGMTVFMRLIFCKSTFIQQFYYFDRQAFYLHVIGQINQT